MNDFQDTLPEVQTLPVQFTGSGSEYFRIWIVNLLLTLVTLSLYLPFARARKMAYFHANTYVGEDALGFTADPWKMFRGYLLVLVLGLLYWAVSHFAPLLAWLPALVLALFWPLLWQSSLRFRLKNTHWRGVRFDFRGTVAGAYAVVLPLALPVVLMLAVGAFSKLPGMDERRWFQIMAGLSAVSFVVLLVLAPWLLARWFSWRQSGLAFAGEQAQVTTKAITSGLYRIGLRLTGLTLLLMVVFAVLFLVVGAAAFQHLNVVGAIPVMMAVGALAYVSVPLLLGPYYRARLQNLVWGATRSAHVRILSNVRFRDWLKISVGNLLLLLVTLGLYWPFAAVRMARLQLEAIEVEVEGDLATWVAQPSTATAGVLGDAVGDFFDVGAGL